jgi:hypothetical protein
MISFPLYALLIIYAIFIVVFLIFAIINLSHLRHTGAMTTASLIVTIIIGAMTTLTFYGTYYLLSDIDWTQTVALFENGINTNIFSIE